MTDYDGPWKEALAVYFRDFLTFFFPRAAAEIDWPRGYEVLDKELRQVIREAEVGPRRVNVLVKVWLIHHPVASVWFPPSSLWGEGPGVRGFSPLSPLGRGAEGEGEAAPHPRLAVLSDDRPDW